jgi:small subunit ribosomal protein S15
MGLDREEAEKHSPLIQRMLSLNNANQEEIAKARMREIRKIFGRHERDTASPAITACAKSEQILALLDHLRKNKQDMSAYIKLQELITKRRKYLMYLKRTDFNSYFYVIKYYGIKDVDNASHKEFKNFIKIK